LFLKRVAKPVNDLRFSFLDSAGVVSAVNNF
jgi:hypothetical protein